MTAPLTDLLLAHRAAGTTIADLPADLVPQTADEAYTVQSETIAALGAVGAWKVQPLPETGEPFAAPILKSAVFADGAALRRADYAGLGIEVEVAITLGTDLPGKAGGYAATDIVPAIASVHIALEMLASRYADRRGVPQLAGIADLQSNGAVVLGPPVTLADLPEFGAQQMTLRLDGKDAGTTSGDATTANMLGALAWLANHTAARGLPLTAGTVVITGARIGPVAFSGQSVLAEAPGLGSVSASFA